MKAILRVWYEYKLTEIYDDLSQYCVKNDVSLDTLKVFGSPKTVKLIDKYNDYAELAQNVGSDYIFYMYPREI